MTRVEDSSPADDLICFIRDGLGCGCPPEVLERIETVPAPDLFADVGGRWLLEVGGRLMVLLCRPQRLDQLRSRLSEVLARGAALRDRKGFNRFRLVVQVENVEKERTSLMTAFDALSLPDDRLHLHLVDPGWIPRELR